MTELIASIITFLLLPFSLCGIYFGKGAIRKISFFLGIGIIFGYLILILYISYYGMYLTYYIIEGPYLAFFAKEYLKRSCILLLMVAVFFCVFFGRKNFKKVAFYVGTVLVAIIYLIILIHMGQPPPAMTF